MMTINTDMFVSDGTNTIFKTSKKYSTNTLTITTNGNTTPISFTELSEEYIQINDVPTSGTQIKIEYTILGTLPTDNIEEYDIKERLVQLEKAVESMYVIIKAQELALNNRVNITTFQAWLKLVEKKTGIKLIDSNLGYISSELYKDN